MRKRCTAGPTKPAQHQYQYLVVKNETLAIETRDHTGHWTHTAAWTPLRSAECQLSHFGSDEISFPQQGPSHPQCGLHYM